MPHGRVLARAPRGIKPHYDRRVRALGVKCPSCPAEVDEPCQRLDGSGPAAAQHRARRQVAVRADNIARGL